MRELLFDLLAYTQLTVEDQAEIECVDLNSVFQKALDNLKTSIEESKAAIRSGHLPMVYGHSAHFLQLFQNLLGNAIKYRSAELPRIHVSSTKNGDNEWIFSVRDNGLGIAPQYFEKIFVLFQRLHGRNEFEGTGIGLAICKKVLERLGGRIWVESQPQGGSTFYFALPERVEKL